MPEQFALNQVVRQGTARYWKERFVASRRYLVDQLGKKGFTRSSFSDQQDSHVMPGGDLQVREHHPQSGSIGFESASQTCKDKVGIRHGRREWTKCLTALRLRIADTSLESQGFARRKLRHSGGEVFCQSVGIDWTTKLWNGTTRQTAFQRLRTVIANHHADERLREAIVQVFEEPVFNVPAPLNFAEVSDEPPGDLFPQLGSCRIDGTHTVNRAVVGQFRLESVGPVSVRAEDE